MKIKVWEDPYGDGFPTTSCEELDLNTGLTVLVGCNGSGKSTLIENIASQCKKDNIPYLKYDDRADSDNLKYRSLEDQDYGFVATTMQSSEGERIVANISKLAYSLYRFLKTGETDKSRVQKAFEALYTSDKSNKITSNKRVILLDAIDSGMSIDNVVELKYFFQLVMKDAAQLNEELYIVVSSNEYELVNGEDNCIDVTTGDLVSFKDYSDFRSFILKTRKIKEKRDILRDEGINSETN
jgi:predicted ATP-binding protein involved in virulence